MKSATKMTKTDNTAMTVIKSLLVIIVSLVALLISPELFYFLVILEIILFLIIGIASFFPIMHQYLDKLVIKSNVERIVIGLERCVIGF